MAQGQGWQVKKDKDCCFSSRRAGIERGKLVCVEPVNETDSAKVRRHVQKFMAEVGAETMRGFKSWDKVSTHPYLSEYLRGVNGVCDLRKVV